MKTIEFKSSLELIKILAAITLTYLILNLSNGVKISSPIHFSNINEDTAHIYIP
jgi:hypothetical protein